MRKFTFQWLLSLLVIVGFAFNSNAQCDYSITLYDSFGDGWNGGNIVLSVNGTPIIDTTLIDNGPYNYDDPTIVLFSVSPGDDITTVYTGGNYTSENYYNIKDSDGIIVAEDGGTFASQGSATPTGISTGTITVVCPTCPAPKQLDAVNVTATTADLVWFSTQSNFSIEYDTTNFVQGTGTTVTTTDTFINVSGLDQITSYQFYVQADCGAGDLSVWAGPYTFTTLCATFTPDYIQDFSTFVPGCWEENSGPMTGPTGTPGTSGWNQGPFPESSSDAARINLWSIGTQDWLISPTFDMSGGGVYLTFDVAVSDYSGGPDTLGSDDTLRLMFTPDGTTWNPIKTWTRATSPESAGEHLAINMAPLTGTAIRFAFWATEGTTDDPEDYYISVDNFEIRPVSLENDIVTFSFTEETGPATIDAAAHTVDIEVGSSIDLINLVASFTLSPNANAFITTTEQESAVTANTFATPLTYTIIAEDGSTSQDWLITVTNSSVNDQTDILTYSFAEETAPATIDATAHTVDIEINWESDITNLTPTYTMSYGATTSQIATDFSNPVVYPILAEDGVTTENWTVTVTVEAVPQGAFCANPLPLTLPVANETGNTAGFGDDYDNACGTNYMGGDDIVYEFTLATPLLLSGDMTTTDSYLGMFILDGCPDAGANCLITATNGGQTVSFTDQFLDAGTYFLVISSWSLPQSIDFDFNLTTSATNDSTDIIAFSFPDQTGPAVIDAVAHTVTVEVGTSIDVATLIADYTLSTGANAQVLAADQVSGTTPNDFTAAVTYDITAQDAVATQAWAVTVTQASVLTDTDILTYSFAEETAPATINATAHTVDIEINWMANITNLTPTYTMSYGATTTQTATNFSIAVIYPVLAEDGVTSEDWTVTVTQEAIPLGANCANPLPAILGMNSADVTVDDQWFTFTATSTGDMKITSCTFATVDTRLWVYSDCPATTLVDDSDDACGLQSEVIIPVTIGTEYFIQWGDNYTQTVHDFEITISLDLSDEAEITSYMLPSQSDAIIVTAEDSILITMPVGTMFPIALAAEFALSTNANAQVATVPQVSTTTVNTWVDNATPIVYDVTAEDNMTIRTWSVYVEVEIGSSDAEITSYMITGQDDAVIEAASDSILVTMPVGTMFPITLAAEFALSANATAQVATVPQVSTITDNTWVDNMTPVVYDVTSEDGTIRSWSVYVEVVPGSSDAAITSFMLPGQDDAVIDAANNSIMVTMPVGSVYPLTLAAEFVLSANATAAVATVPQVSTTTDNTWVDNSTPVVYNVTAEDGTTMIAWSVYVDIDLAVNNVIDSENVTIYPNPNTGEFNIAFNLNNVKTVNIEVLNIQGQIVRNFDNVDSDRIQIINLSEQSEGMYFVRISSENETVINN